MAYPYRRERAVTVQGMDALQRRLRAIGDLHDPLREAQVRVIGEAKRLVPRKTGNLGRSIVPGYLRADSASVEVRANYARYVEEGTGLYGPRKQRIVPKNKKALRWNGGGPSKVRLSDRSRTKGGVAQADAILATSVKGRKATPFLEPAVKKVAKDTGIIAEIVSEWNRAA